MADQQSIIHKLSALKDKDTFSDKEWQNRGLNPSSSAISSLLNSVFTNMLDQLINALHNGKSKRSLRAILSNTLSTFNTRHYDTEEKEFIGGTFITISKILDINFSNNLNRWMYGPVLGTLINLSGALRGAGKIVETLSQECVKCKCVLETYITAKEKGIPDHSFQVIRCNECKEYNLLDKGPDIKGVRFGNYTPVEQLLKEEYTKEQAEIRVEQIRIFRKD